MHSNNPGPCRFVTAAEFDAFVRAYPRALDIRPPLQQKARFRVYCDPSLGSFPENIVAKWHAGRRNALFEICSNVPPRRRRDTP
jgi:hypothetical protein